MYFYKRQMPGYVLPYPPLHDMLVLARYVKADSLSKYLLRIFFQKTYFAKVYTGPQLVAQHSPGMPAHRPVYLAKKAAIAVQKTQGAP